MTPEEFRKAGHAAVDWIAEYWQTLAERPVTGDVVPGSIAAQLAKHPPTTGEPIDSIIADVTRIVPDGLVHWQHPGFFGYFPSNTSGPSIIGDLLCAGLGVQGMLWATSPACTEVETVMMDWLADLLDLPATMRSTGAGGGAIQDSASSATLVATLAALHRASGGTWRGSGTRPSTPGAAAGARFTAYTSVHGHSSIHKAAMIAGIGEDGVRSVAADESTMAMLPKALAEAIESDLAAGMVPALVVATIGTTSTGAIDPIAEIAVVARRYGLWLHVDGAYAGAAGVCPEFRWVLDGLDQVDSFAFDPHKWLLTGFDCSAFWVADRSQLVQALTILPEYLRNAATESGAVIDYRDWQVPLGRRFRALKLLFVLRWYGAEGLRRHIRRCVDMAQRMAERMAADDRFEIVAPHPLSLLCFRLRADDEVNQRFLDEINATGRCLLSHTKLDGRLTLRMAVGTPTTTPEYLETAWQTILDCVPAL